MVFSILDIKGLALSCYHGGIDPAAIPNAEGKAINTARYGVERFIKNCLLPILENRAPINVIGVNDGKDGNMRRRLLYPAYKLKTKEEDPIEEAQKDACVEGCWKLLLALGSACVSTPGIEADDTIAYLCQRLPGGKIVHTVDADLLQLRSPTTSVLLRGEVSDAWKGIDMEHPEFTGDLIALYKSICGDTSDGYLGVRGVGQKAWDDLKEDFGYDGLVQITDCLKTNRFDLVAQAIAETGCKTLSKLMNSIAEWKTSWLLAKLHPEWCEGTFGNKIVLPVWVKRVPEMERLEGVLNDFSLTSYIPLLSKYTVKRIAVDAERLKTLDIGAMVERMRSSNVVAFDYESYDPNQFSDYQKARKGYVDVLSQRVVGCSFAFGDNLQYCPYFSANHADTSNVEVSVISDLIKRIDIEPEFQLVCANPSFEMTLTKSNFDYEIKKPIADTYELGSHVNENHVEGLKGLSRRYLNYIQQSYTEVVPEGKTMKDISLKDVLNYACDDSICTAHLYILFRFITWCEGTFTFANDIEPYFQKVMSKSFAKGIEVDYDRLSMLELEDAKDQITVEERIRKLLLENCSEVNESGFKQLWSEIYTYESSAMKFKNKTPEQIEEQLTKLKEKAYSDCKYVPLQKPDLDFSKRKSLTLIAHTMGFPGFRSIKTESVLKYVNDMRSQATEQEVYLTAIQEEFLTHLENLAPFFDIGAIDFFTHFDEFCRQIIEDNPDLWIGDELNIDSPKQMAQLLYGKMSLPILIRNIDIVGTGKRTLWELPQAPSTGVIAIETMMAELPIESWRWEVLNLLLKLRAISTKFKLYYKPYPLFRSPVDGRIHPSVRNCGTVTRRPTGSAPNILQVSKKEKGKMRSVILPLTEDEVIVSIDFDQQELVILAGLSNDTNLRSCYQGNNKRDVHSLTGLGIYNFAQQQRGKPGLTYERFAELAKSDDKKDVVAQEVIEIRKKKAKMTNFLMVYGGSEAGLARKAIVPKEVAGSWVSVFFDTYPGVTKYMERQIAMAKKKGFVTTLFGNRKHCDKIFNPNKAIQRAAERQAINQPIQGAAADVLKIVMKEICLRNVQEETNCTIYAPVYDEVVASVPKNMVAEYIRRMSDIMEMQLPHVNIGLTTSVSIGKNWGDQIELGNRPPPESITKTLNDLGYYATT